MRYLVSLTAKQRDVVLSCLDYIVAGEIDGGPLSEYDDPAAEARNVRAWRGAFEAIRDAPRER